MGMGYPEGEIPPHEDATVTLEIWSAELRLEEELENSWLNS